MRLYFYLGKIKIFVYCIKCLRGCGLVVVLVLVLRLLAIQNIVSEAELNQKIKSVLDKFVNAKKTFGIFQPDKNRDYSVALKGEEDKNKTVYPLVIEAWFDFNVVTLIGGPNKIGSKTKLWIDGVTYPGGQIKQGDLLNQYDVLKPVSKGGKLRKSRKQKRGGRKSRKNRHSRKSM